MYLLNEIVEYLEIVNHWLYFIWTIPEIELLIQLSMSFKCLWTDVFKYLQTDVVKKSADRSIWISADRYTDLSADSWTKISEDSYTTKMENIYKYMQTETIFLNTKQKIIYSLKTVLKETCYLQYQRDLFLKTRFLHIFRYCAWILSKNVCRLDFLAGN